MRKATATNNRAASAAGASTSMMTSSSTNKPLIVLEFSGHDTASIGYADIHNNIINILSTAVGGGPLYTVPLPPLVGVGLTSARDAEHMFGLYAAPLAELWSRLHEHKHHHHHHHPSMTTTTSGAGQPRRKVVVIHSQGLYANRYWKLALGRLLHNVLLGFPLPPQQPEQQQQSNVEVAFVSALEMVPMAIAATTPKAAAPDVTCLTVFLSATEVQCVIYAMGHGLEYTYQSCSYTSCGGYSSTKHSSHITPTRVPELQHLQQQSLQQSTNTIVTALSLCLQACPVPLRRAAVHNIVVAGSVVVPQFARHLARRLHQFWNEDNDNNDESQKESKQDDSRDIAPRVDETLAMVWAGTAIHKKTLQSLSPHIGIVECSTGRSALLPWIGARFWSLRQNQPPARELYNNSAKSPSSPTAGSVWKPLSTEIEMY